MNATLSEKDFTAWVNEYADILFAYASHRCSSGDIAKDLVQETFLAAWRTRHNFRNEASPKTWLMTILKSKLIDHYRKLSSRIQVEELIDGREEEYFFDEAGHWRSQAYPAEWSADLSAPGGNKEFISILNQCRNKLKSMQALIFTMKYVDEADSDLICQQLQISTSNYWVLMHRAKVQLRACLQKNWIN